jgi:hypothetical protein
MSDRKDEIDPENDYIEQLQWQTRHGRRWPVRFEPKWKYTIRYRTKEMSFLNRVLQFLIIIGAILLIIKLISSGILYQNPIATIFIGGILLLTVIIIFFAVRDTSQDKDDGDLD